MNEIPIEHILYCIAAFFLIWIFMALFFKKSRVNYRHRGNIEASYRRLIKINEIGEKAGLPAQLNYLRKVNAYVFEEMILSAIEQKTHAIKRNLSYSGDGGLDGEFTLNGAKILIQAKRYKDAISTQHVKDFVALCERNTCRGIFVHTGRTPKSAFDLVKGSGVEIISGEKLIRLLTIRLGDAGKKK